jgi:drug/metabolite transporter (DMT)-like permease
MREKGGRSKGIKAALASALFLGLAPVFGKQAITLGFSPLGVVAFRTCLAAGLLLLIVVVLNRSYLFIYPAGLLGCMLAGTLNGIGSVFYYLALGRLSVSMGQLLYSLYPVFLVLWLIVDRQPPSQLTYFRIIFSLSGILLLTLSSSVKIDWIGVILMLAASAMYAIHLPINQRVLYDIPAPTVTMYTLLSMSLVVVPAYLIFDRHLPASGTAWIPILALTGVTFFSRLMLFLGIKNLGGMQTALLGLSELFVSISISHVWLRESLNTTQWIGAAFLGISLLLISFEKLQPEKNRIRGLLAWLRPPEISSEFPLGPQN